MFALIQFIQEMNVILLILVSAVSSHLLSSSGFWHASIVARRDLKSVMGRYALILIGSTNLFAVMLLPPVHATSFVPNVTTFPICGLVIGAGVRAGVGGGVFTILT
jgi:hypothetical protein